MQNASMASIKAMFTTRLNTLSHLLKRGEQELNDASFLDRRIFDDMHPLGAQVALTCTQPRNFALWAQGRPKENLDTGVTNTEQTNAYISETKELLAATPDDDAKLAEQTRIELGPTMYAELSGIQYVNEFLVPNFYFHLVTAYDILRMAGLKIGKQDYMGHLAPFVRQA